MAEQNSDQFEIDYNQFIKENKQPLCFLLKIKESSVSESDIGIVCKYLVHLEAKSLHAQKGKIDSDLFNFIKIIPSAKRGLDTFFKALEWNDIGSTLFRPLAKVYQEHKRSLFTPAIQKMLMTRREVRYKKEFSKLSVSSKELNNQLRGLVALLQGSLQFGEDLSKHNVSQKVKEIQNTIKKCNWHAKAGAAWAIKNDIPIQNIELSIAKIYAIRMKKLSNSLNGMDQLLQSQGICSNISNSLSKGVDKLMNELKDTRRLQRKNEITSHKIDQTKEATL